MSLTIFEQRRKYQDKDLAALLWYDMMVN